MILVVIIVGFAKWIHTRTPHNPTAA